MLYALLKLVVKIALNVFYKNVEVKIKSPVPAKGPLIVVANHPNTFMDPIVIASILPQHVYFLTNGAVFKNPTVGWLLGKMNMIPVYRKEDVNGQTPDNRASFAKCYDFLAKEGTLLIFPEGSSVKERRLRKLKTGTARIALGAEAENNFNLGIKILTVGLNYSDPVRFRSELYISVDQPIDLKSYKESYQKDPYETVNILTEQIRQCLESHLIITRDEEEDNLVKNIEMIYKDRLSDSLDIDTEEEEFLLTQHIVEAVRYYQAHYAEKYAIIKHKIIDYTRSLKRLRLQDRTLSGDKVNSLTSVILSLLYIIVGFPVYVYGLINNYIPYIIPSKVARLITKDEVYMAPIMMSTGIFSFGLCYSLQITLFHAITGSIWWITAAYALSLPLSGFLVLHYWNHLLNFHNKWLLFSLFYRKKEMTASLVQERRLLIRLLEEAKKEYENFYWQTKAAK